MARYAAVLAVLCFWILTGCNQAALMKRVTPREDEVFARNYVDLLRQGRFDQLEQDIDSSIKGPTLHDTLVTMAAMFPAEEPTSAKVVGVRTFVGNDSRETNITLEYEFSQKWLLAEVLRQQRGGVTTVLGFHVTPIADSLENLNRFTLADKGASQYTIFSLAVLAPVFSLYAFVVCIRTKMLRRKWLWLILVLIGVGKLSVDWTTGQIFFIPLAIQLPPAGAVAPLYSAWQVYVSLPLGAFVFLFRRNSLNGSARPDKPANFHIESALDRETTGQPPPPPPPEARL